jgi:hypothetical protein
MSLSKAQLEQVLEAIRRHFNGFVFEAIGERALTPAEIEQLQRLGLLKNSVRNMIADPVLVGRLVALIPPARRTSLSLEEALKAVKKVSPMTAVEKKAVEFAQEHAGTYIKGIRDMVLRDTTAASSRASGAALLAVRRGVSEAIANRETVGELKTRLFDLIDNRSKDWQRVAHTEINSALQHGIHSEILAQGGPDQLVYKRPSPGACKHCKRVYLKDDGTPRVFKLSQLADTNVGLRAVDWEPTIGSVHPWCSCQLMVIPEGYNFRRTMTVKQDFEFDGVSYKIGQVIPEEQFKRFGPEQQGKIGFDPVLTFTGESAKPEVEKSFRVEHVSDNCFCEHD